MNTVASQLVELLAKSAEGAFIEVGVFIGAILVVFNLLNFWHKGRLVDYIRSSRRYQPVIGALLGLTPGCGGAVFVMPLFFTGSVSFGTVVATLMATMGDAAFVLVAYSPRYYLLVSVPSFLVAVMTGYIVDQTRIGSHILHAYRTKAKSLSSQSMVYTASTVMGPQEFRRAKHILFIAPVFWLLAGVGFALGIAALAQIDINALVLPHLGLVIGIAGTSVSLLVSGWARRQILLHTGEGTLKSTMLESFLATTFIITWVFAGFMAYHIMVWAAGGGNYVLGVQALESLFLSVGVASIFVAVAVGVIPGCGPQIIFVSLFSQGLVPFSALLANAVSQDGDALFPVLAMDRTSAIWATLINKIPALLLGILFYVLEGMADAGAVWSAIIGMFMGGR